MRILLYVFWLIIIILGITFALLNANPVNVNYYLDISSISLPLLLLIVLVIGAILGVLAMLPKIVSLKNQNRRLRKACKNTNKELQNLRNAPIKDET